MVLKGNVSNVFVSKQSNKINKHSKTLKLGLNFCLKTTNKRKTRFYGTLQSYTKENDNKYNNANNTFQKLKFEIKLINLFY